jgi:hypothetical protein
MTKSLILRDLISRKIYNFALEKGSSKGWIVTESDEEMIEPLIESMLRLHRHARTGLYSGIPVKGIVNHCLRACRLSNDPRLIFAAIRFFEVRKLALESRICLDKIVVGAETRECGREVCLAKERLDKFLLEEANKAQLLSETKWAASGENMFLLVRSILETYPDLLNWNESSLAALQRRWHPMGSIPDTTYELLGMEGQVNLEALAKVVEELFVIGVSEKAIRIRESRWVEELSQPEQFDSLIIWVIEAAKRSQKVFSWIRSRNTYKLFLSSSSG